MTMLQRAGAVVASCALLSGAGLVACGTRAGREATAPACSCRPAEGNVVETPPSAATTPTTPTAVRREAATVARATAVGVVDVRVGGPQTAVRSDVSAVEMPVPVELGADTALTFSVRNLGQRPVRLAAAVETGEGALHRSPMETVPAGGEWKSVSIDLAGTRFASEATDWASRGTVADLDRIRQVQVLVYHGLDEAHLQFDDVRYAPPAR